jgi:hypothetical protein
MLPKFEEKGVFRCWTTATLFFVTNIVCQFLIV